MQLLLKTISSASYRFYANSLTDICCLTLNFSVSYTQILFTRTNRPYNVSEAVNYIIITFVLHFTNFRVSRIQCVTLIFLFPSIVPINSYLSDICTHQTYFAAHSLTFPKPKKGKLTENYIFWYTKYICTQHMHELWDRWRRKWV